MKFTFFKQVIAAVAIAGLITFCGFMTTKANAFNPMPSAAECTDPCPVDRLAGSHVLNQSDAYTLSNLSFITDGQMYVKIFSGISVADFINLTSDIYKLRDNTDIRTINMILNSPGGSAFDGLSMADIINRAQNEWGFTVSVNASGIVASAAVPIFAVCKERHAAPGTLFMVHEAALWKWPGRESMSDIISQGELMKKLQKQYLSYLVSNSTATMEEWQAMEKKTTWFTVDQARALGLIERGVKATIIEQSHEDENPAPEAGYRQPNWPSQLP